MSGNRVFLGRPLHWALWFAVIVVLTVLGKQSQHVRDFVPFLLAVLGLATAVVAVIVFTHRPGERVTREPLDDEDSH
jgi:Mn2+/Fe2+ NRAMP family transporter